ncbi:MAG: biotin--[acetyl-CoA-carboxylase] ligase [Candidatus Merdivicinus sp.]|jgi:BirA family biotin operon repressor/biotin-[acetyl-CoA-carboxylase] ligase
MAEQSTRYAILEQLRLRNGSLLSGGELAEQMQISRTAVWKHIASLQEEGYSIETVPNKGYRLLEGSVFSGHEISRRLTTEHIGKNLIFLETVDSTNEAAKKAAAEGAPDGTVIVAKQQTQGRGRLARKFESPAGFGVYLTILLRPEISIADLNLITLLAAVVAADTIEQLSGKRPGIKWTNDLFFERRKICGILTECAVEGESGRVGYAAVGIGMNLLHEQSDFPPELQEIAGSVKMCTGISIDPTDYTAALLKNFEQYYRMQHFPDNKEAMLDQYRRDLFFLGQPVQVVGLRESYPAVAIDVDEDGRLLVRRENGMLEALNSGEISIRF